MKKGKNKSVDQMTIAKMIATRTGMNAAQVYEVIELEQKTTMSFVKKGYKVIKKNFITLSPVKKQAYQMKSKLNGQTYDVPERVGVKIRIGQGFKSYLSNPKSTMPNRLCRFVDSKYELPTTQESTLPATDSLMH